MAIGKHGYVAPPPLRLPPPPSTIRTEFIYPPIPVRSHDWVAWLDGREEDARFYGYGATEDAARLELAAAVGAWEEERGERAYEANRASRDWMKDEGEGLI